MKRRWPEVVILVGVVILATTPFWWPGNFWHP